MSFPDPHPRVHRLPVLILLLLTALMGVGSAGTPTASARAEAGAVSADRPAMASLSLGDAFGCGLDTDGAAWCWGLNTRGQLGIGTTSAAEATPRPVVGGHRFIAITAGGQHTCAIDTDGAAWCWGQNSGGALGTGDPDTSATLSTPARVEGGLRFTAISAGPANTCAVAVDGRGWCWGRRQAVGNAAVVATGPFFVPAPVPVDGGLRFTGISVGNLFACATTVEQTAVCWGAGALGNGVTNVSPTPAPVAGEHRFVAIDATRTTVGASFEHVCAIDTDAALWCWGSGGRDVLGFGPDGPNTSPTPRISQAGRTFRSVATSASTTCAVGTDGESRCWGANVFGALGTGVGYAALVSSNEPVVVTGRHRFRAIAITSSAPTACGLDDDSALWCWGRGNLGQRGDGVLEVEDPTNALLAGSPVPVPVTGDHLFGPAKVVTVTAGGRSTFGTTPAAPAPSYSGFRTGQGPADLTSPAACTTTPPISATTPAGVYPVTCGGAAGRGYSFAYPPGTWTVDRSGVVATTSASGGLTNLFRLGTRFSATVRSATTGGAAVGVPVTFTFTGSTPRAACTATTNASGVATCTSSTIAFGSPYIAATAQTGGYLPASVAGRVPLF